MFFSGIAVWGHRGWPSRFPDNVVAGIRAAAEVAAGVEVDIRRARDGTLVLAHDPDITGHVVAETDWAVLADLDVGSGHRPTRLDDVVHLPVGLDLEVKNLPWQPGFEADHRVALEVAEWARPADVVSSFHWPSLDAIRGRFPAVPTGLLFDRPVDGISAVRHAVDVGHAVIAPHHEMIDADLADAARREGLGIVAWTVNTKDDALRLAELGVAAIITDRPGELIAESADTRNPP